MLFNLIILALFGAVAYFQYTQGLFSATLSTILCIIAAVTAVGYYELVTPYLMKLPEQADAVAICVLFAAVFFLLRQIFDRVIPGNVRFPVLMDKIGAGVMGVISGLFATGVLALAAQSLPFGPEIGGYYRQDLQDRPNVTILGDATGNSRPVDTFVTDELVGDRLGDPNHINHLWFHQDDLVLRLTRALSDNGSALSDDHPLEAAHPDLLLELFGQRLGAPIGTKRVAVSPPRNGTVHVAAAWSLNKLPHSMDDELNVVRNGVPLPEVPSPNSSTALVVLRVSFSPSSDVTDSDGVLRLSPSNVQLKAGNDDYYPIGTLVGGTLLLVNRADDPMGIDLKTSGQNVDFVFVINNPEEDLKSTGDKEKTLSFKNGSYLEIKRYALVDLSGMEFASTPPPSPIEAQKDVLSNGILGGVIRKRLVASDALAKLASVPQKAPSKNKAQAGAKPNGKSSGSPSNDSKTNEFLPPTPGREMGL